MRAWKTLIAAAALSLTGCVWTPGKFTSELALHKGGAFVLDYRGEIIFQMPNDKDKAGRRRGMPSMAQCYVDRDPEFDPATD